MERKLEYSFDDEPISKFCYDLETQKIRVHFRGYYDLIKDAYIDAPCIWFLYNWQYVKVELEAMVIKQRLFRFKILVASIDDVVVFRNLI